MDSNVVIGAYDQARFTLDADVRKCWAPKGSTPIVYKNGSKKSISIGGTYLLNRDFHYYKMSYQLKEEVLWNIKLLKMKCPNLFLLLDKATWNKNKLVTGYMKKQGIPYMFFPTGASDLSAIEECWRQTREDVTANTSFNSEKKLFESLRSYWDKKPFKHNLLNYLSP